MRAAKATITLSNIHKRFKNVDAVNDVTLKIDRGEVVGFVGPNGAGKTTTLALVMGYLRPTKGTITVLGCKITPETSHTVHKDIGFIAGDMTLPGTLTGKQFLAFMAGQNGRDRKKYDSLILGLGPVLDRPIHTLSRGNKQKIALIAALQHSPKVLILDEPTSGLDPLMQETFLSVITSESHRGTTVLMSSHILSEISCVCTRIVFMRAGKLILDKPIEQITEQLGKHVTISSPQVLNLRKYLPHYVEIISQEGARLHLSLQNQYLRHFLQWVSTKEIIDITIEDRELDDIFHDLYTPVHDGGA